MNETEINKLTYLNNVKLTYQDLLDKMNMIVYNGSIYVNNNSSIASVRNTDNIQQQAQKKYIQETVPENSYIYNKYFSNQNKNQNVIETRPRTIQEYKALLIKRIIEKQRLMHLKPKKMMFQN